MTPTLLTSCSALPPEGALAAWGGPALLEVSALTFDFASLPPGGAFAAWGGPALLKSALLPGTLGGSA